MSEQWLVEQSQDEVLAALGDKARTAISNAIEIATARAYKNAESAREAAASSEASERDRRQRLEAEYDAAKPLMRQVWSDRFWERATPERIGKAWEACATFAMQGFPYAGTSLEQMRQELRDRFGVDPNPVEVGRTQVAELLAAHRPATTDPAPNPEEPRTSEEQPPAPEEPDASEDAQASERAVSYVIAGPGGVVSTDVEVLADDDGGALIPLSAAERLCGYLSGSENPVADAHLYRVEVYEGREPRGDPRYVIDSGVAGRLDDRRRRIVNGERFDNAILTDDEGRSTDVRDALRFECRRLRDNLREHLDGDPRFLAARQQLADEHNKARDPGTAPAATEQMTADEHAERTAELRGALAQMELRADAADAELRGEDSQLIAQAAVLRRELDDDWWQTATPKEVAGVWEHVGQWSAGTARDRAIAGLHASIFHHHNVDVGRDASPREVARDIYRAQAEAHGDQVFSFRIETIGAPDRVQVAGLARASRDEAPEDVAHRLLAAYAADPARRADLRIVLGDADDRPLTSLPVGAIAEEDGVGHGGEELRRRAIEEDNQAASDGAVAEHHVDGGDPAAVVDADVQAAAIEHDAAQQDHDAAATYEGMDDQEAAQAAQNAALGFPEGPVRRLGKSRDRGLGPSAPTQARGPGRGPGQSHESER